MKPLRHFLVLGALLGAGASVPAQSVTVLPRESIEQFMQDAGKMAALKKAITAMKALPITDKTSWRYQAAIHGKFAADTDGHPTPWLASWNDDIDDSDPNWNQCRHASWWFPIWHRGYIYYFERILQKYANDPTLRLPYWDYSASGQAVLPAPFRTPASSSNPLWIASRNLTGPGDALPAADVDITAALGKRLFIGGATRGFGGKSHPDSPVDGPYSSTGALENVPHNIVHVDVGGVMGYPPSAALDPIFWLHHSNIDRLWDVWEKAGHSDPGKTSKWSKIEFTFIDENGAVVTRTALSLLKTTDLGYTYTPGSGSSAAAPHILASEESLTEATTPEPTEAPAPARTTLMEAAPAAEGPVVVGADPQTVDLGTANSPQIEHFMGGKGEPFPADSRVILTLEDIRFDRVPGVVYEVYVNQPNADFTTLASTRNFVGLLTFFEHHHGGASAAHSAHAAEIRSRIFDITALVRSLKAEDDWDPAKVRVTIVPRGVIKDGKPSRASPLSKITIARIHVDAEAETQED